MIPSGWIQVEPKIGLPGSEIQILGRPRSHPVYQLPEGEYFVLAEGLTEIRVTKTTTRYAGFTVTRNGADVTPSVVTDTGTVWYLQSDGLVGVDTKDGSQGIVTVHYARNFTTTIIVGNERRMATLDHVSIDDLGRNL